jgi:TPR repeat protein
MHSCLQNRSDGDAISSFSLRGGQGVAKSTQTAGEWYRRAAEAGEPITFSHYRYLFEHGLYRPASTKEGEALQLYKKAAEDFAVRRYDISFPDLKRASELGFSWATLDVGTHYEFGDGVQKNAHTALEVSAGTKN